MKKRLLCFFMLLSLLCTGCTEPLQPSEHTPPVEEEPAPPIAPTLENYITESTLPEAPIREYGESISHIRMTDTFVARILYPEGGLEALDKSVEHWVVEAADAYQEEATGSADNGEPAELTVDYTSYLIDDSLVSVKLSGVFDRPYLAHPIDVSASFNASKKTGKLLTLADIFLPSGEEALRSMVIKEANIDSDNADGHLLDHWLLTPDGLEITLVRGEYLSMSEGTVTLFYSYEELEGFFAMPETSVPDPEIPQVPEENIPAETEPEPPLPAVDPSKPMLALTFDDGPSSHTARLLDAFATYGGKGTFYVVGNMLDSRRDVLLRMSAEGHEIGGHGWNHRQLTTLGEEELTQQLMGTRAKIYEITGVDSTTVRPPYGSFNPAVKAAAAELGISLINWSVDTLDWQLKDAEAVYNVVMEQAQDGAIILCHDLHKTTVEAMERAIPALIAEGYQLVTVTELLTAGGKTVEGGNVYFNG